MILFYISPHLLDGENWTEKVMILFYVSPHLLDGESYDFILCQSSPPGRRKLCQFSPGSMKNSLLHLPLDRREGHLQEGQNKLK